MPTPLQEKQAHLEMLRVAVAKAELAEEVAISKAETAIYNATQATNERVEAETRVKEYKDQITGIFFESEIRDHQQWLKTKGLR